MRRRLGVVIAMVVAAATLSACTFVPTDSSPKVVPAKTVPFGLLTKHPHHP